MKVEIKKLPACEIELRVEVPADEFDGFIEKAVFNLGENLEIAGFRKGKAPKEIVENVVGTEKIFNEAAQLCLEKNYARAILENKIEPLGRPEIEILKIAPKNPFIFRARIVAMPDIRLADYKKIASGAKRRKALVEEKEVGDVLNWLKKNHRSAAPPSGRNSEMDDKKDEPAEINDEWARKLGKFENLDALKKNIRQGLEREKEIRESQRSREEILEKIAGDSDIEAPDILVEEEAKRRMENLKREAPEMLKISFEEYLAKLKKTEAELLESFLPEARKKTKSLLVLREIAKKENIAVSEDEIKNGIGQILSRFPDIEKAKKEIDLERLKLYIEGEIKNEKTLHLLESFVK